MGAGASTANGNAFAAASGGGELGTLCFSDIELDSWPGKVHAQTGLPTVFQLLLGHESLDFVDNNNAPLVQFPYQVIISWGYSPNTFRFSVPAKAVYSSTSLPPNESVSICVRTRYGVAQAIDRDIMKTVLKLMDDMKKRSTCVCVRACVCVCVSVSCTLTLTLTHSLPYITTTGTVTSDEFHLLKMRLCATP